MSRLDSVRLVMVGVLLGGAHSTQGPGLGVRKRHSKEEKSDLFKDAGGDIGKRNWLIGLANIWNASESAIVWRQEEVGPSSMFLIRTLRSTMSRSVVNCSLSEVTRRTMSYYRRM